LATSEFQEFEAACTERLLLLQSRSAAPALPASAQALWERVRKTLQKAAQAELLRTGQYGISRLLRPVFRSQWHGTGTAYEFSCGPTHDKLKDPKSPDCLVRDDDAVLSSSVTVGEKPGNRELELIAYRFDLAFPIGVGIPYVRFDLDPPNERHAKDGLRAHIHPGLAEGRLPSAILDPVEAIHFLLVHLRAR
jgi:hypothetical protein